MTNKGNTEFNWIINYLNCCCCCCCCCCCLCTCRIVFQTDHLIRLFETFCLTLIKKVLLVENILNWRHFLRFDDDDDTIVLERQLLVSSNFNIKCSDIESFATHIYFGFHCILVFRQNRHLQGSKLKAWHIFVKHVILWIGCDKFLNIINHILLHLNQASRLFTTSLSDAFTCFQCNIILTYIW